MIKPQERVSCIRRACVQKRIIGLRTSGVLRMNSLNGLSTRDGGAFDELPCITSSRGSLWNLLAIALD